MAGHSDAARQRSALARVASVGLRLALVALIAAAGARAYRQYAAHRAAGPSPGLAELERALELDPQQPEFLVEAGRLYRDRLEGQDLDRAERYFDAAIRLNPHEWRYRFEKGRLLEIRGQVEEAEAVLLGALDYTPHGSAYRWRVANFFVRRGDTERALEHLAVAVAGSRDLQEPGIALLRNLGVEPARMAELWPPDPASSRRLLMALVGTPPTAVAPSTARAVRTLWERLLTDSRPVSLGDVSYYLRFLLLQGAPVEARAEWLRAVAARGWVDDEFVAGRNLVWNGGFELALSKGALDWYVAERGAVPATRTRVDEAFEGDHVLILDHERSGDGTFRGLTQQVVVDGSGTWQVAASLRTDSDNPRGRYVLDVLELPGNRLVFESDPVAPTTSWLRLSGTFDLPADSGPRRLRVRLRPAGSDSDSMPFNHRLWLDAFGLAPGGPTS